ncbi:tyrosine-type recombinase/integrase [Chengkuizengella marina]|uniref:Site-specific recombinase XerD n=1 Tax=Chengkuizengella marina TaxID=2507566 RepID=A0A6N9PYM8_9BACL|nr:tyrosine-type recombinase/integrase [Chengkuizengella marina]NBI28619.1 hypothetical protein [Chengkuizengella marina]
MEEKVVLFQTNSVYEHIQVFLNKRKVNSSNTYKGYIKDIRQFFSIMRNKKLESLDESDLKFKLSDIEQYQTRLATDLNNGKPYAPGSINRKIDSLKSLYKNLEANDYNVKSAWFNVSKIKGDPQSYGIVYWDDVQRMIPIVIKTRKGLIKSLLIETAVVTSFRQDELLRLRWDDVTNINGTWVMQITAKGKVIDRKPIKENLYNRLLEIKQQGQNKIFPLDKNTISSMMIMLRKKLDLPDNITFHSFKKCGINEVYQITNGDIEAVKKQGNHKSFSTTDKHYRNFEEDRNLPSSPNLSIGESIDLTPLENLSREALLQLVKNSSRSTQSELLGSIQKG